MNYFKLAFVVCLIASQIFGSTDFAYSQTRLKQKADSIYFGGTIITMEGEQPGFAEAVAVGSDKIIAVGSKNSVLKTKTSKTRLIDLRGQTLIPGVIDPHLHLPLAAIYFLCNVTLWADEDWHISGVKERTVRTPEDFLTELGKAEATLKDPQEWLIPFGYAEYFHGIIGRRDLDKISLTRPIMLYHRSTHEVVLNTKAMEEFGFTGNNIPNDPMVNVDRGFFAESAFFRYIGPKLLAFMMQGDRWETFLKRALEYMHRNGITTVADMLAFDGFTNDKDQLTRFRKVIDAPDVPLRTYMVSEPRYVYESKGADAAFQYMEDQPAKSGKNIIYLKDAKLFADGGFFGQQMRMKDGYTDGHQGVWITPPELFTKIAGLFWNKQYPMHVHVNGDEALDFVLSVYSDLKKDNPTSKSRVTLHHLGYSRPEQIKKIKELGFNVQLQPYYVSALGDQYATHGLDQRRAHYFSRAKSLLNEGIITSFHSDFPIAPSQPLFNASVAVNRIGQISGNVLGPEERISVYEALRAITINAAYSISKENEIGSIKIGKKADFTLLSKDPLKVDPKKMSEIRVTGKVFNGRYFNFAENGGHE